MALQGKLRLDLSRKGQVVKRIEKKNTITAYPDDLMCEGNYGLLIPRERLLPVKQFFEGCVLTDRVNDASISMLHHNANITACAGNDGSYAGTNPKRGRFSALDSSVISSPNGYKGYRFVWEWGTAYGNGWIASVCLTKSQLAVAEYFNDGTVPSTDAPICDLLYDTGVNATNLYIGRLHIVDYEREVAYRISYANNTISIDEYQLSCKNLHLLSRAILTNPSDAYQPEFVDTHPIAQQVANFTEATSSISYTGDKIYIITWSGSNIKAYPINIADWSMGTIVEKTFNEVTFTNVYNSTYNPYFHKDIILLDGNYAWCMATTGGVVKMLKIDLLGATPQVTEEKTIPFSMNDARFYNGCCMLMPNGDFYKFPTKGDVLTSMYYHNDTFYQTAIQSAFNKGNNANMMASANGNVYGSSLICFADDNYNHNGGIMIASMHGFVSTVANLGEAVKKDTDLTMKLTYEITESAGS